MKQRLPRSELLDLRAILERARQRRRQEARTAAEFSQRAMDLMRWETELAAAVADLDDELARVG